MRRAFARGQVIRQSIVDYCHRRRGRGRHRRPRRAFVAVAVVVVVVVVAVDASSIVYLFYPHLSHLT